jgi:hypothetical protein
LSTSYPPEPYPTFAPPPTPNRSPLIVDLVYNPHQVPYNYPPEVCAEVTRSGRVYKPPPPTSAPQQLQPPPPLAPQIFHRPEENSRGSNPSPVDVTNQLKKVKADISIWDLIHTSAEHREAFLRVFQAAHVPNQTTPETLEQMVAAITTPQLLAYSIDDLSPAGKDHNYPLYVLV